MKECQDDPLIDTFPAPKCFLLSVDGHIQTLCDELTQGLVHMLEDLELLVDNTHVSSLTHVPDNVVD